MYLKKEYRKIVSYCAAHRQLCRAVLVMSAAVLFFGTFYVLKESAMTMNRVPQCGIQEHVHEADCYETGEKPGESRLVCTLKEHRHEDSCYFAEEEEKTAYAEAAGESQDRKELSEAGGKSETGEELPEADGKSEAGGGLPGTEGKSENEGDLPGAGNKSENGTKLPKLLHGTATKSQLKDGSGAVIGTIQVSENRVRIIFDKTGWLSSGR